MDSSKADSQTVVDCSVGDEKSEGIDAGRKGNNKDPTKFLRGRKSEGRQQEVERVLG